MFRLLRYFSITSLIAMALVTILLGMMYRRIALTDLVGLGESKNVALTQALANSLWPHFGPFLTRDKELGGDELRARPEIAKLRGAVLEQMHGLSVVKVKIYNIAGRTVFSTETKQIGEDKSANAGFLAARSGQVASELTHRDTFSAFEQTIEDRDLISSYVPVRDSSGPVQGVFELYYDVTPLLRRINRTQTNVVAGVIVCLGVLYMALFFIVRHADRIIRRHDEERKQYLDEIQRVNETLEGKVQERTRELTLLAEQLSRSNKVKDDFLHIVSHELRTPLNVAMGYAALLRDGTLGELNDKQQDALDKIKRQAQYQLGMISNILQATQMKGGEINVHLEEFNLSDFLTELKSACMAPVDKEIGLSWDYPQSPTIVKTDNQLLKHILQNLINNAVKFTDAGSVSVSAKVSTTCEQRPAGDAAMGNGSRYLEFRVIDTGVGIPKEALPFVFEKFRQVDTSETRDYDGVGLGLYIVQKYTELLGGQIKVDSEVGKGSTFTVMVPCA